MKLLNQTELDKEIGLSVGTISRFRKSGAITPVIKERMVIGFDLDHVQ